MSLLELSKKDRKEISFIEVAIHIFEEKKEPIQFKDLIDEVAQFLELSSEEVRPRMVQFYTDLNVDGRFISLGENSWGLREWYPIDQIDEEVIIPVKPKKKKKKKVDEDDLIDEFDEYDDLDEDVEDDDDDVDETEDESLEALREEEEDEYSEEDIVDDIDYDIDEDDEEEIDIDEEDLDDEDDDFDEEEEEEEK